MGHRYYIRFGLSSKADASSKAMRDIMSLLDADGYRPVRSLPLTAPKWLKVLDIPILVFTLLFLVGKKGTIMYIIPSNHSRIALIKRLQSIGRYRTLCFINDVESLRMPKSQSYARAEMESIRCADIVLAPNRNSIAILQSRYACTNRMIPVGVWDYLHDGITYADAQCNGPVAFAGNLRKAPFVQQLGSLDLSFEIWGDSSQVGRSMDNVRFMGQSMPDELPQLVKGCAWGLVWDGESISSGEGMLGEYLRFNNSHKCGLYLAAGIPVIVWSNSGMASFVRENGVGICVDSLMQAQEIIRGMDEDSYALMRANAGKVSAKVIKGYYFLEALKNV